MRFLVIDDNSVDRLLLVSLLKGLGYPVRDYESSEGLEEQITRQNYTAIFLDIILPGQDGYQFLRSLKKKFPEQPQYIIFYSGKSSPVEINYGIKVCAANDYLNELPTDSATLRPRFLTLPLDNLHNQIVGCIGVLYPRLKTLVPSASGLPT